MTDSVALVVDDTPANLDFLERLFATAGFKIISATTGADTLTHADTLEDLHLAVIDMQLPDMSGLQLTKELRQRYPDALIVVATMHDEASLMESAFAKGSDIFLVKPHGFMELFKRLTSTPIQELRSSGCLIIDQYGPRVFNQTAQH